MSSFICDLTQAVFHSGLEKLKILYSKSSDNLEILRDKGFEKSWAIFFTRSQIQAHLSSRASSACLD